MTSFVGGWFDWLGYQLDKLDTGNWITVGVGIVTIASSTFIAKRSGRLAVRAEQRELADRYDAEGPQFEQERADLSGTTAEIELRMVGGPTPMHLTIHCQDIPWVRGVSPSGGDPEENNALAVVKEAQVLPGQIVPFTVQLSVEPAEHRREVALVVTITAESSENPPRSWLRQVPVQLAGPPMLFMEWR